MVAMMPNKKPTAELHPLEEEARKKLEKIWKLAKKQAKILKKWLFFYQPENKMDASLHMIDIIAILYITLRLVNGG